MFTYNSLNCIFGGPHAMRRGICALYIFINDKTLDLNFISANKLNCIPIALADNCFNVPINYSFSIAYLSF